MGHTTGQPSQAHQNINTQIAEEGQNQGVGMAKPNSRPQLHGDAVVGPEENGNKFSL